MDLGQNGHDREYDAENQIEADEEFVEMAGGSGRVENVEQDHQCDREGVKKTSEEQQT